MTRVRPPGDASHDGEPADEQHPTRPGLGSGPLFGFRIGVTSDRRSEDLIAALVRRGAHVVHAPALTIAPNQQDDVLVAETRALIEARPDIVPATTGYGVRRWFEVADAAGLGSDLVLALDGAQVFARGLDAVTFTSAPAAEATLATARHLGLQTEFVDALRGGVVAAAAS
ncbi:MAG: uroporphyrinogen-III synthase, partial [Propionibacteriaceae bacterium]